MSGITTTGSSYYSFIGLPNATDISSVWDNDPPAPVDNFDNENQIWDTMIGLKKITSSDARLVVPKIEWRSGNTFDMYRHDYSTSNTATVSGATTLYGASFYVMNSDYRVYICLENGTTPETPNGAPSLDEPTFVDLEPRAGLVLVATVMFGSISIRLLLEILSSLILLTTFLFLEIGAIRPLTLLSATMQ